MFVEKISKQNHNWLIIIFNMQLIAAPPNPEDDVTTAMFFSFYSVLKFDSLNQLDASPCFLWLRYHEICKAFIRKQCNFFFYMNRRWYRWGDRFCKNRCGIYNRRNLDSDSSYWFLKNDSEILEKWPETWK